MIVLLKVASSLGIKPVRVGSRSELSINHRVEVFHRPNRPVPYRMDGSGRVDQRAKLKEQVTRRSDVLQTLGGGSGLNFLIKEHLSKIYTLMAEWLSVSSEGVSAEKTDTNLSDSPHSYGNEDKTKTSWRRRRLQQRGGRANQQRRSATHWQIIFSAGD